MLAQVVTRKQAYFIWRCLREHVPGFARSAIGVREKREIAGDQPLTADDLRYNHEFVDAPRHDERIPGGIF